MDDKFCSAKEIREAFNFLEKEYYFKVTREASLNYGSYVDFIGNSIKISLGFDYKDYHFYFLLFHGAYTRYSDKDFGGKIKSIESLILKFNSEINVDELQPNNEHGYKVALKLNSELLKKYGDKILTGKEWF